MKCEADRSIPYSKGEFNQIDEDYQIIRLSEGCPNNCPFCREGIENPLFKLFEIPELTKNKVRIIDMNLLCHSECLEMIKELGRRKVNNKVIYYELVCGIDYRFLTQEIAIALKQSRFRNIRIAWDHSFGLQMKIKDSLKLLFNAGYSPKDIMVFMICNWKISYEENIRKMDLCKIWNIQIADCYFDNQLSPNIKPIYWTIENIKEFRHKVRSHNQMINFGIDPDFKQRISQLGEKE